MAENLENAAMEALRGVLDPELGRSIVEMGMVRDLKCDGGVVTLRVELTTPACPLRETIERDVRRALMAVDGVREVRVSFGAQVRGQGASAQGLLQGVKNVILVGSGKGGVGKSTVAVGLALGLARSGAKTGLLDADIYGPSIPTMLGVRDAKPASEDGKSVEPVRAHGLAVMSIGFFVDPEEAVIWRGPMLQGAIVQFLRDVRWGDLDYLVMDLPPGTGDVQLTLAQQVKVAGAVIVTTPQDLALADAIKARTMFERVDVPVLGIVENMSYFECPHCKGRTEIFHHGGGAAAARKLGVPFLGEVPLVASLREAGDSGVPVLVSSPESPESRTLRAIAERVAGRISLEQHRAPQISTAEPRNLVQIKV